ncbi:hypothetical protein AB4874_10865 [Thioclava sp. 15-R06ZXC-3]|uniref:Uncharacterized protein n=1 Tax=Thioclava arctica TaxID=3238301 RepID=A0ABV3TKM0_9RHOB
MTIYIQFENDCASVVDLNVVKDREAHRWIIHSLAEIIEYSEAHELHEVAKPLITAIEEISPFLAGMTLREGLVSSDDGRHNPKESSKVVSFQKWKDLRDSATQM